MCRKPSGSVLNLICRSAQMGVMLEVRAAQLTKEDARQRGRKASPRLCTLKPSAQRAASLGCCRHFIPRKSKKKRLVFCKI